MPARTYPRSISNERKDETRRHGPSFSSTPTIGRVRTSGGVIASTSPTTVDKAKSNSRPSSHQRRPRRQQALRPSPPPSHQKYPEAAAYDLTSHTLASAQSHYQSASVPGLPSAAKWPHHSSVADRKSMDDDLLGLGVDQFKYDPYSRTARISEEDFESTPNEGYLAGNLSSRSFKVVGRYGMTIDGGVQGAIFAWDQAETLLTRRGYSYDSVDRTDETIL
ncbi:uncharacterized protein LY89DRAFT_777137 [Mollisia scopiformis]|uniref:Uncharacterized protein n=1 Tax=Mollisia scopiformis TaxID=149040 RepID=A0A194XTA5_MOLSC|nr:uncharacterized protein LY89DRAFT_777137 [Mollisia scopiformis]KUJ23376.1 hypothetical protein LY89DRAFT_777137 [Mollisia scopiformis]